jgi:formylglycine-generating enzyme required for sulfatase activity
MGSDDRDASEDERPRHRHPVAAYSIARHQTTWRDYLAFAAATERPPPYRPSWSRPDHPVVMVSWKDAKAFCRWAGGSLPTEAEWEKAARGTEGQRYAWGDAKPSPERCVTAEHPTFGRRSTAPVGSCPLGASPYGALDMGSNVREWCDDAYEASAYVRYRNGDLSKPVGENRVSRGCGWRHPPRTCRASLRIYYPQGEENDGLGFRLVIREGS